MAPGAPISASSWHMSGQKHFLFWFATTMGVFEVVPVISIRGSPLDFAPGNRRPVEEWAPYMPAGSRQGRDSPCRGTGNLRGRSRGLGMVRKLHWRPRDPGKLPTVNKFGSRVCAASGPAQRKTAMARVTDRIATVRVCIKFSVSRPTAYQTAARLRQASDLLRGSPSLPRARVLRARLAILMSRRSA